MSASPIPVAAAHPPSAEPREPRKDSPRLVTRALALAVFTAGVCALLAGVCALPPIAERWILADAHVGSKRARIALYLVALCGVATCLVALRFSRVLWSRSRGPDSRGLVRIAAKVAGAVVVTLIGIEVCVRSLLPVGRVLASDAQRFHEWNASDWDSAERLYMPSIVVDADLGWAPKPGFRSERVNVNSAGIRGLREYALVKPAGVRRIVLIGDSYTWGERTWTEEIRDQDTFGARLEHELDGVEVLNFGVSGYGTDQAVLRLEKDGFRYAPDLVVLGIFTEDLERNTYRFHTYAKPYFSLEDGALRVAGTPVPSEDKVREIWSPSQRPPLFLWALAERSWDQVTKRTRFVPKWTLSAKILDQCFAAVSSHGARLLVLHFPVEGDLDSPDGTELHLRRWAETNHVTFVALREAFIAAPLERTSSIYDGHLTAYGNELVADALRAAIAREHLLD